ncbi:MAG: sigma-70 family RNA polymerase sigma factor, partial [Pseudonocardia sp.]|nr:sigma-70 family RNA polymerase sigma factor [Pseudonocardia sp.]
DAYGDLFARHVDAARRLARQLAGPADADDLVSDAFTKVLTVLQRGGGPDLAFRAYLLTAVRRLHVDKIRSGARLKPVDDLTPFDPGLPFHDTAVEGFENAAAAKAFASLPERWQMVLWHTEVEQQKPADIAPLLGMSANSVSALAYRAREGLRQAFLSQHATDPDDVDCAWTRDHLGAYVRSGLSRRDAARVDEHLAACRSCAAVYLELTEVNSGLAGILAPLLLGSAGAGYVSSGGAGAGAGSSFLSSSVSAAKTWAAAHASLTAIGGIVVTATAVVGIYGAAHLHSRDAAQLGSPPPLSHGSVTSTVGPGNHHGRTQSPGRNGSQGPGSDQSSTPPVTTPTTSQAPSTSPTTAGDTTGAPTGTTTGPTDGTSNPGGPTTGPTGPTTSPTGPPGGGGDLEFTSTPPANPSFGDTYTLHARGGSGKQIVFSIDPDTTHQACSLDDAGTTVTFDHAGLCVIAAHADARGTSGTGAARSTTDATQRVHVDQEDQKITFRAPDDAAVGTTRTLTATSSSGLRVTFSVDPTSTDGACDVTGSRVTYHHALSCSLVASQAGDHDYRPAPDVSRTFDVARGVQTVSFTSSAPDDAVVDGASYSPSAATSTGDPVTVTVGDSTTNDACAVTDTPDGPAVAFHHHGTCALTASTPGDADYLPATATQSFGVGKGSQTVSFTSSAPDAAVVDGSPYPPT